MEQDGEGRLCKITRFDEISSRARATRLSNNTRVEEVCADESGSEAELVKTIHSSDQPWFYVTEGNIIHAHRSREALNQLEEDMDLDVPLKFRPSLPLLAKVVGKIRDTLVEETNHQYLLVDMPDTPRHPDFSKAIDVVFPVMKRKRCRSPEL